MYKNRRAIDYFGLFWRLFWPGDVRGVIGLPAVKWGRAPAGEYAS